MSSSHAQQSSGHAQHPAYGEYAGAKQEWTAYLAQKTAPVICEQFKQLYDESVQLAKRIGEEEGKQIDATRVFEMALNDVPVWNSEVIKQKTQEVESKIPKLKAILKETAVAYVYVMSSVRLGTSSEPLDVVIPSPESFVHKLFSLSAEDLEPTAFPLAGKAKHQACRKIVAKNVPVALRDLINPDEILNDYFNRISEKKEYGAARSRSRSRSRAAVDPPPLPAPEEQGMEVRRELDREDKEAMEGSPETGRRSGGGEEGEEGEGGSGGEGAEELRTEKAIHLPKRMMRYSERDMKEMLATEGAGSDDDLI